MEAKNELKVTSIFLSVNGEVGPSGQGSWTVFARFFGCSAKCRYCDTKYSHVEGSEYTEFSPRELFAEIIKLDPGCRRVTLTGGEPLEQDIEKLIELILLLRKFDYEVSIETNGMQMRIQKTLSDAFSTSCDSGLVSFVVDFKLPSSGNPWKGITSGYNSPFAANPAKGHLQRHIERYKYLGKNDFVKFVISNKEDFLLAIEIADQIKSPKIYFSPCGVNNPGELFQWMKEAGCAEKNIGFNLQIHKFIFGDEWRDEEK